MRLLLLWVLSLVLMGAGETPVVTNDTSLISKAQKISFTSFNTSSHLPSSVSQTDSYPNVFAITSEKDLENYPLQDKTIDFSTDMLLVAEMGQKLSGGYAIEIKEVYHYGSTLMVLIAITEPKPDSIVTMSLTYPVHMVKLPQTTFSYLKFRETHVSN